MQESSQGAGQTEAHGRYYAEYVELTAEEPRHIQAVLDEKDGKEWQLVGVAGGFPGGAAVLFWDTRRPGFARGAV